jgi:hypothetical protein
MDVHISWYAKESSAWHLGMLDLPPAQTLARNGAGARSPKSCADARPAGGESAVAPNDTVSTVSGVTGEQYG